MPAALSKSTLDVGPHRVRPSRLLIAGSSILKNSAADLARARAGRSTHTDLEDVLEALRHVVAIAKGERQPARHIAPERASVVLSLSLNRVCNSYRHNSN